MPKEERNITVSITTGTVLKGLLVVVGLALLFVLRDLALIILTSVVIAAAVEPGTKWFARRKIGRLPAVLIMYMLTGIIVFGFLFFFALPLFVEVSKLSSDLPQYIESIKTNTFFANVPIVFPHGSASTASFSAADIFTNIEQTLLGFSQGFLQTASIIFGGVFSFILIVVLSFYLAVQERGIENFLRVILPDRHEEYILDLWARSQHKIGKWFQGQLLLGVVMGVLVFLGLTIFQVKYALTLAILAGIAELIPVFGPIIAAVPAVGLAFTQAPITGIMVLGFYIIVQRFENDLLVPLVITKIVGVPPLLVILSLIVGAQLAGFLGMILSIPLAVVFAELFMDVKKRKFAHATTHARE